MQVVNKTVSAINETMRQMHACHVGQGRRRCMPAATATAWQTRRHRHAPPAAVAAVNTLTSLLLTK